MKKLLALVLAAMLLLTLAACGGNTDKGGSDFKAGFIFLHDENSTYDLNFINAAKQACENLGVTPIIKTNIDESNDCYEAAADLADQGCGFVFADSFGHEDFMIKAAEEFPEVQFAHATGTQAHTKGLANFHNAFASIYEGRYLAGVAAGMKLNEMIESGKITPEEAKIGYVGAFTYAEVISGYTSFYLGAKSDKCVLLSQHADSMGAPTACENAGVPDVSYNGSTKDACPNTFIVSSRIDWTPYLEYAIKAAMNGEEIDADWTGTLETASVALTEVNTDVAAEGTVEKIEEVKAGLADGSIHVFDTAAFTVGGETLTSYQADVDSDAAYTPDTEVIADGYFHESEFRSAPYFDLRIDGITLLNEKF